jgi:hypothetical protein
VIDRKEPNPLFGRLQLQRMQEGTHLSCSTGLFVVKPLSTECVSTRFGV